jgi:hypothetical protein
MKTCLFIIVLAFLNLSCATQHQKAVDMNLNPWEDTIRQRLQWELVPFPQTTPFDSDGEKRQAYLTAFSKAWDFVVSGEFLQATIGVPIPENVKDSWNAGWKDGYSIAGKRWMFEFEKLQQANARKNPSP